MRFVRDNPSFYGLMMSLSLFLGLAACAGGGRSYNGPVQCAPYARSQTGIMLGGHAAWWWREARGRYRRIKRPVVGSAMVFRATRHMPYGHLAVVRKIMTSRRILVDQANWQPGEIEYHVPVDDISRVNDWSLVRVWWAPSGRPGKRSNPVYGFILPP